MQQPIQRLASAASLVRDFGPGWTARRLAYEMQLRLGVHRLRFPRRPWDADEASRWLRPGVASGADEFHRRWTAERPSFFFDPARRDEYADVLSGLLGPRGRRSLLDEAEGIAGGRFRYFFARHERLGLPPEWHLNPFRGHRAPADAHWSRIPMWSENFGDMKYVWEPGRFAAAYTLARAYWLTGDEAHAETFWTLVESWREQNPPNSGAHWKCGQETSLRIMAWCFGLYALADARATTPERLWSMLGMLAAQADRVAKDHVYSQLQRNNHAISEGVGLWTVGVLFPWLARADAWRRRGQEILESEGRSQINPDGTFIQKSANYHRLMLHDYLYAVRVGAANGHGFSDGLHERLGAATDHLHAIHDPCSGGVPNLGGNDGALILPLNECDYQDYRPVCAATGYVFRRRGPAARGPWLEDLLWLAGPEAVRSAAESSAPADHEAPIGGYFTLRGKDSWVLLRCGRHRDRPAHADMLHLDVWWKGLNLARDPGTYRYYDAPPWNNSLAGTEVHNTVAVDGLDQMDRGPRFTWSRWSNGTLTRSLRDPEGGVACLEGEHDGYTRLREPITHRRAVVRAGDLWLVIDDLVGRGEHAFRLHWLLEDFPFEFDEAGRRIDLHTPRGDYGVTLHASSAGGAPPPSLVRGSESTAPRGWISEYYGVRRPALSASLEIRAPAPVRFVTLLGPASWALEAGGPEALRVSGEEGRLDMALHAPGSGGILSRADYTSPGGEFSLRTGAK